MASRRIGLAVCAVAATAGVALADPQWTSEFVHDRDALVAVPADVPVPSPDDPAYDRDHHYITPADVGHSLFSPDDLVGNFGGTLLAANLGPRWASAIADLDHAPAAQPVIDRAAWASNGTQVGSCPEYVYERWWDYSQFEDRASYGEDYRAMFELGAGLFADGINAKGPDGEIGEYTAAAPSIAGAQAKNEFFTVPLDRYPEPAGHPAQRYEFRDPTIPTRIAAGTAVYHHTVTWHQRMSDTLAEMGAGDDLLYALAQKQKDFAALLAKREAMYQRWGTYNDMVEASLASCPQIPHFTPWDRIARIWDPPDLVDYFDLHSYYARPVIGDWIVRAPEVFAAQPGAGVVTNPALDLQERVAAARERLLIDPDDAQVVADLPAMEMEFMSLHPPGAAEIDPDDLPYEPIPGVRDHCQAFFARDGLPLASAPYGVSCEAGILLGECRNDVADQVSLKLREVDAKLETAIEQAEPYGCLTTDYAADGSGMVVSPCDWNPEMFVREMQDQFVARRERDHSACITTISSMWGPDDPIHTATTSHWEQPIIATDERALAFTGEPAKADYTGSVHDVHGFIAMMRDWADKLVDYERDKFGRVRVGHNRSDGGTIGDQEFGASYGYEAGWKLTNLESITDPNLASQCQVGIEARAEADISGRVFGKDLTALFGGGRYIFKGETTVTTTKTAGGRYGAARLSLELYGQEIYTNADGGSGDTADGEVVFNVSPKPYEKGFALPTIPVTAYAVIHSGISGKIGFKLNGTLTGTGGACPIGTDHLKVDSGPEAGLDVYASVGVTIADIAEAGIQIDLNLFTIGLPFTSDFTLEPFHTSAHGHPQPVTSLKLHATPSLSLAISVLAGHVSVYVDVLGERIYEDTLKGWDGIKLPRAPLLGDIHWNFPLFAIVLKYINEGHH